MNFKILRGKWDAFFLKRPERRPLCRTPFVIVSYARTGSSYLMDRLDSHPEITCWGELFNRCRVRHPPILHPVPEWWATADLCHKNSLRVFSEIYRLPAGTPALGFKFMRHHGDRLFEMILNRRDIKVIFICRRNLFRQYLSNLLSQQSLIYSARDAQLLEKHRKISSAGVRMEPEGYRSWVAARRRSIERIRKQFTQSRLDWIEVAYEDITGPDQLQAFNRSAELLDVSPFPKIGDSPLTRLNPDPAQKLVQNFDEITALFRGTADEWMLES
jgi:hypothetical protein